METFLAIAAVAMVLLGLAGVILPLLPGTPLVFGGLWLAAWLGGYERVGGWTLLALGGLALLAWLADYVAAAVLVKRAGGSNAAATGAGLGALVGLIGGLPGLILGPVVGASAGQWHSQRDAGAAVRVGMMAGMGFVAATAVKLVVALAMIVVFALAWWR